MISRAEVDKLLGIHAADPAVLSIYVQVPLDPAALRGLPTRVGELIAAAERTCAVDEGGARHGLKRDREAVRELLKKSARDWLGHMVAIFSYAKAGLIEGIALPGSLPARGRQEKAVLARRPYVRPLLSAIQRSPAYFVTVVDRRNAWVFKVLGERIETIAQPVGEGVRSSGFGGWYGLEAYRIHERVIQLARHHYRETAAVLERATRADERAPLVVGGREKSIAQFLGVIPAALRDRVAGSFVADPHTMTAARVRELAAPALVRHVDAREARLVNELREVPPGGPAVTGLPACARAVNQRAAALLIVGDDVLVPGFACGRCGRLALVAGGCGDCGEALAPVPDLIEEMVIKTIDDGGQVEAVADPPEGIAARLRFPLTRHDESPAAADQA